MDGGASSTSKVSRGNDSLVRNVVQFLKVEIVAALGTLLLKLLYSSMRWSIIESTAKLGLESYSGGRIFVFWHDQQLVVSQVYYLTGMKDGSKGLYALASRHADGRIIARIMEWLGFRTVLGSSSRGGGVALHALIGFVQEGYDAAVTPDGPRGPRHEMKDGAVKLAELAEAAIYPLAIGVKDRWTFGSWDRMFLPKPFSKAVIIVGSPIHVPKGLANDDFRRAVHAVEEGLREVNRKVDTYEYS